MSIKKSNETLLGGIITPALEAVAESMGLEKLPESVRGARPEVLNSCTLEVLSFIIFYADRHEKNEGVEIQMNMVIQEWQKITGSHLCLNTLYKARSEVFNKSILGKKKFSTRKTFGIRRGKYNIKPVSQFASQQRERKAAMAV